MTTPLRFLAAMVLVLSCAGCAANSPSTGNALSEKTVMLELPVCGASGYDWTYAVNGTGVVTEISRIFVRETAETAGTGVLSRTDGKRRFLFEGVSPGEADIVFACMHPGFPDKPAAKAIFRVTVLPGNAVAVADPVFFSHPKGYERLGITFGGSGSMDKRWWCKADRDDIVKEESHDTLWQNFQPESDTIIIADHPVPGTRPYYFRGIAPGEVTLFFKLSSTETGRADKEAEYSIRVYDDLTLDIVTMKEKGF